MSRCAPVPAHRGGAAVKRMRKAAALPAALLLACLCALPAQAAETTGAIGGASFRIEQVYVNVPELDIFFYAAGQEGEAVSPAMVQAAGVELRLGDEVIDTGAVGVAADPICYCLVIDNDARLSSAALASTKAGIRRLIAGKGANDQIALFTTAGGTACVLGPTTDAGAAAAALADIRLAEGASDLTGTAADIYRYVNENYQSLAPRKALFAFTQSAGLVNNLGLAAALAGGYAGRLNMETCTIVACDSEMPFPASENLLAVKPEEIGSVLEDRQRQMSAALEIKTDIPESRYGEKLELLTLTVPKLGSAVQCTATVYMGHRLTPPAVEKVEVIGRSRLRLTFNQAVDNAGRPGSYRITSSDIWNFRVGVASVEPAPDGRSAVLTTAGPLYEGSYEVGLKNVTSRVSAVNVSSSREETAFRIAVWPRDRAFYLARLRLPLLLAALLLAALAGGSLYARRKDRAAEQAAEAEHLLAGSGAAALPRRWLTLFIRARRSVAETRWAGVVESSLLIGSDAAQCDLCLEDSRVAPQHCLLGVDGDALVVCPLGDARVRVNNEIIGGSYRLQNGDTLSIGRTTLRIVL